MARPYYQNDSFPWKTFLKVFLMVVFVVIFSVIAYFMFSPTLTKKDDDSDNKQYERYVLPAQFTYDDFAAMVEKMRSQKEFTFDFFALTKEQVKIIVDQLYPILDQNRTRDQLFLIIQDRKIALQSISELFYRMDYPQEYIDHPKNFPELNKVIWEYQQEEFQLAILGVVYKANFDRDFTFKWDKISFIAAEKLKQIILAIKEKNTPPKITAHL